MRTKGRTGARRDVVKGVARGEGRRREGGRRCRAHEDHPRAGLPKPYSSSSAMIAAELLHRVDKAAPLERIALTVNEKELDGVAYRRDESDRDWVLPTAGV